MRNISMHNNKPKYTGVNGLISVINQIYRQIYMRARKFLKSADSIFLSFGQVIDGIC